MDTTRLVSIAAMPVLPHTKLTCRAAVFTSETSDIFIAFLALALRLARTRISPCANEWNKWMDEWNRWIKRRQKKQRNKSH